MKPSEWVLLFAVLVAILCSVLFPDSFAESRYIDINRIADLYVDAETGVVYYLIRDVQGMTNMMCLCPRYRPDGSLYTW